MTNPDVNPSHDGNGGSVPGQALTVKYVDWELTLDEIPANVITPRVAYLLQNGFTQSMTDAAAMTKDQKRVDDGHGNERDMTDDEVAAETKRRRDHRYEMIVAGTVGARVGAPRGTALDTIMRAVATERAKAKLAKINLAMPNGNDKAGNPRTVSIKSGADVLTLTRADLIARQLERFTDAPDPAFGNTSIRDEANKRLAATKTSDVAISDVEL